MTGRLGSAEGLDAVLAHPACAQHIVRRLALHVVGVAPSEAEVERLAERFQGDDMHVGRLLRRLATSEAMLGEGTFRTRVPSPVTLCVTLARRLDLTLSPASMLGVLERAGQTLFVPPGVDGWPHDRDWLNSTWALHRAELAFLLLDEAGKHGLPVGLTRDDPTEWIASRLTMDERSQFHFERAGAHLWKIGHRADQLARRLLALPRSQLQ